VSHLPDGRATAVDDRLMSVAAVPGSAHGRVTVEVDGEVDSYTAPLLEACLNTQTGRPGLRTLVVDLERVRFLGATGAAVLARAHARCARQGARLVVRRPQGGIVPAPTPASGAPRTRGITVSARGT
jgi:anti-anti-sigma factor